MPRINKKICFKCVIKNGGWDSDRCSHILAGIKDSGWYGSWERDELGLNFFDLELDYVSSPIYFKDKKHAYENCLELALDRELDVANRTTEWHICEYSISNGGLVCERIYDKDAEYCAKHNKQCQYYQCGTREGVNSENYCSAHQYRCNGCQVRVRWINNEDYCSEHQYKCGSCEKRTDKEYCSQHTYKCYVNNDYPSFACSERLAESNSYCSNHRRACKYYFPYHCRERLPLNKSVCDLCQTSDLCLKGCGRRIAKYTTYCSLHREEDELKGLIKQRTNLPGLIYQVERLNLWWSKENVATIITINGNSYWVFLGVIDRKPNAYGRVENNEIFIYPTNHNDSKWGIYPRKEHNSLAYAQSEAQWLKEKLNGDNPILVIHPLANDWTSFTNIVCEPYVRIDNVVLEGIASIIDFKPLDIAWIRRSALGNDFYHVGVYLGNGELCHIAGGGSLNPDLRGVRKCGWDEFLKDGGPLHRYHPIIPFKHYEDVINQIGWAMFNYFRDGQYCLSSRNCEHFANMLVYGINYSKQVDEKRTRCWMACPYAHICNTNNSKGSTICLRNEIKETNNLLEKKSSGSEFIKINERYEAQIEVLVKTGDCVIM